MSSRNYSQKTIKFLYAESGNVCAYPECSEPLVEDGTIVSNIAHILPASENGPRGGTGQAEDLNKPENLLLLCLKHHKKIDDKPEEYPVNLLKNYKQEHIDKIKRLGIHFKLSGADLKKAVNSYNLNLENVSNTQIINLQNLQLDNSIFAILANHTPSDQKAASIASASYNQTVNARIEQLKEQMDKLQIDTSKLLNSLSDPSTKEFMSHTFKAASLAEDPDLYKILAKAVQERINDSDTDGTRKDVAFAQVPELISRLTTNQLKLIALNYIATSIMVKNTPSLEFADAILSSIVNPIGDVKYHKNDINQISGTSAGNYLSFWENKAFEKVKQQYDHLFISPIAAESIDNSNIDEALKDGCLKRIKEGYILKAPVSRIDEISKSNGGLTGVEAIKQLVDTHRLNDQDKKLKIAAIAPTLNRLIAINDDTDLKSIDLSLPGRALAVAVIEGYSGNSLSSLWVTDEEQVEFPLA